MDRALHDDAAMAETINILVGQAVENRGLSRLQPDRRYERCMEYIRDELYDWLRIMRDLHPDSLNLILFRHRIMYDQCERDLCIALNSL